ncbi:MAG: polynucleotide adenylyltransferase PcnB [Acidiferrobacterales bacterium]|nr:polynucleotide adenylyltransferase PcnB [Acidiferrobacterales bacterium]
MKPVTYSAADFGFGRDDISSAALDVVDGLQSAGFDGYLVGGCVRDLLLGRSPKDFDVTTDASPEEVKQLFRRSRIIGRRFRIVHVRYGREIIEVATYRANPNNGKKKNWLSWAKKPSKTGNGRILDDNVYGTIDDDATRRDLTANALYYDPNQDQVLDFVGGVQDIQNKQLRIIGKPNERFAEDPVRMLRVLRFQAKLDLIPEKAVSDGIKKHRGLMRDVPAARMFDEVLKMFHHAHGVRSWALLVEYEIADYLFAQTISALKHSEDERWHHFITLALENTDRRIKQDKPVIPAYLYAVLLWRSFLHRLDGIDRPKASQNERIWQAGDRVFAEQCRAVAVPKRVSGPAIEIWQMQWMLERRRPKTIQPLLDNRRFRAAYDFLLLRSKVEDAPVDLVDWWTRIQDVDADEKEAMISELRQQPQTQPRSRRRPRRRKSRSKSGNTAGNKGQVQS